MLTSMVEGCGVAVVPSSAGEDANADFRNVGRVDQHDECCCRRGWSAVQKHDTRMSVTLMKGSSLGARRHCQPPVVLTCSHMIVQQL